TVAALRGLGKKTVLILGGDGKGQDFSPLAEPVSQFARRVLLIGRDAPRIAAALNGSGVQLEDCGSLEEAVEKALRNAAPGDAVPARGAGVVSRRRGASRTGADPGIRTRGERCPALARTAAIQRAALRAHEARCRALCRGLHYPQARRSEEIQARPAADTGGHAARFVAAAA